MTEVTIIIPNYNGQKYIGPCLDAVLQQTYGAEIIVVDDGSEDDSIRIIEGYDTVRLIRHTDNLGFAAAVNTGIRNADTPYVILLNNDTVADKDMVRELLVAIKGRKKAFSVSALLLQTHIKDRDGNELVDDAGDYYCALGWAFSPGRDHARSEYMHPARVTSACAGAAIYDRTRLERLGLFDEAHFCYLEDVDIGLRALRAGYRNYYEPAAVVYHKASASSGSRYNAFKTELTTANNLYLIYKNLPLWIILLDAPLLMAGALIKGCFYIRKGLGAAWLRGLKKGMDRIAAYRGERAHTTASTWRADVLLYFELLGNCVRRLAPFDKLRVRGR